jgi:hypothetical protein
MRYGSWALILIIILGAGCGRQEPPNKGNAGMVVGPVGAHSPFAPPPAPQVVAVLPEEASVAYESQLASRDATSRLQAAQALRNLGEAGFPALLRAMQDGAPEVRKEALEAVDSRMLSAHAKELLPVLWSMLRDRNPTLRALAASRLTALNEVAAPLLPELRQMAKADPDPSVRNAAEQAALAVNYAVTKIWPPEWGLPPKKP